MEVNTVTIQNKKVIMLILTDFCNLCCSYCYEEEKKHKVMTLETAKKIIDENSEHLSEDQQLKIEFFGGEVLTQFTLLKEIYSYAKQACPQGRVTFGFTTNGTLMHGEIKEWFEIYGKDFSCTLSLDGTKEMHDKNRKNKTGSGSFSQIDIPFFLKIWPGCTAKMTISQETLPDMAEGVKYLEGLGFYCKATFASGIRWNMKEAENILMTELEKLVEYYSQNEIPLCNLLDLDLRAVFNSPDVPFRYCDAGVGKKCYDMDGHCYPCQGLASTSVGEEKAEIFEGEGFEHFKLSRNNPCRACQWLRICRTCYAANFLETENIEYNSKKICRLNRMVMLASSAVQYKRIMRETKRTRAQMATLKAVQLIQKKVLQEYGMKNDITVS